MSAIEGVLIPMTHDLGGFKVRRVLPAKGLAMIGPFCFVDQFGPALLPLGEGMDVRPHPHIGLSTVTWLFEGAIEHRDSLGTFSTIAPGTVNLMTAGRGIVHSERSPASERAKGARLAGMQTWLALPDGKEEIDPAFESVAREQLPLIEASGASAQVIMGSLWGATSPVTCHTPTIYADISLAHGASLPIDAEADERALMLVDGEAWLEGEPMTRFNLYGLAPGLAATLRSTNGGRVMLLGGAAFTSPRILWWNFVSSSQERIDQAAIDWTEGKFPPVPGDVEHIPLPGTTR